MEQVIDKKRLIEDLIPILNEHGDMYLAGKILGMIDMQPQSVCSRREWYQKGYQDGLNADKWITCSERLPSEYGQYLYTDKNDEVHEGCYCPPLQGMIRGWSTCEADGYVKLSDEDVIAWQPLPQPYKKEGAE